MSEETEHYSTLLILDRTHRVSDVTMAALALCQGALWGICTAKFWIHRQSAVDNQHADLGYRYAIVLAWRQNPDRRGLSHLANILGDDWLGNGEDWDMCSVECFANEAERHGLNIIHLDANGKECLKTVASPEPWTYTEEYFDLKDVDGSIFYRLNAEKVEGADVEYWRPLCNSGGMIEDSIKEAFDALNMLKAKQRECNMEENSPILARYLADGIGIPKTWQGNFGDDGEWMLGWDGVDLAEGDTVNLANSGTRQEVYVRLALWSRGEGGADAYWLQDADAGAWVLRCERGPLAVFYFGQRSLPHQYVPLYKMSAESPPKTSSEALVAIIKYVALDHNIRRMMGCGIEPGTLGALEGDLEFEPVWTFTAPISPDMTQFQLFSSVGKGNIIGVPDLAKAEKMTCPDCDGSRVSDSDPTPHCACCSNEGHVYDVTDVTDKHEAFVAIAENAVRLKE